MLHSRLHALTALTLLAGLAAQAPYQGNGQGNAFVQHTMARIGGSLDIVLGSPSSPCGFAVLAISDSITPVQAPIFGLVGIDPFSPMFSLLYFFLDAPGNAFLHLPMSSSTIKANEPPLFVLSMVLEPNNSISISRTSRVQWANVDTGVPGGDLAAPRLGHTTTALGKNSADNESRLLVCGGGPGSLLLPIASNTAELWSPLTRSSSPTGSMAQARALHQAVRLGDGRVLVCGGMDTAGNVTATVEIFDPRTGVFTSGPSMRRARAGHAATLLGNGRILVTGGVANYTDPLLHFAADLDTAQDTGELFDPAAGTWTLLPGAMASKRSGHLQTLLPNGRVFISGGIQGGFTTPLGFQLPVFTPTANVFDPATNTFLATGAMQRGRAFHGQSLLPSGDVLVTGGVIADLTSGFVGTTVSCERWNGSAYAAAAPLQVPVAGHAQFVDDQGRAAILGGLTGSFPVFSGSAATGRHTGSTFTPGQLLGNSPIDPFLPILPRGGMTVTQLCDGSWVLLGGNDGKNPVLGSIVFRP